MRGIGSLVDSRPRRPGAYLTAGLMLASRKARIMMNTESTGIEKSAAPLRAPPGLGLGTRYNSRKIDRKAAILELAVSFPTLNPYLTGTNARNWDINRFMADLDVLCSGARHAKIFVAAVWDPDWPAEHGMEFRVVDAISVWDAAHRGAFLHWCQDPFWP